MSAPSPSAPARLMPETRSRFLGSIYAHNSRAVLGRGLLAAKTNNWIIVVSGFVEPVLYLLSFGIGLGSLVGSVTTASGAHIPYAAYIAPALLAVSAMNGAVYDSTWNVYFKMTYAKLYEGMLATSIGPFDVALGEITYALLRGVLYAAGFMIVMQLFGLNLAWTAVLALPAVVLIAFGFASLGMGITSYMKTFQQMEWINLIMLPMFIFSATFYPITVYPPAMQYIIEALPLWHGVELIRGLTTGDLSWGLLWHVLYFAVMIVIGLVFTTTRLRALFLS